MNQPIEDRERLRVELSGIATEYYVAARMAYMGMLRDITCNLYHHAFEMIIKAALVRSYGSLMLKRNFGHDLSKLWKQHQIEFGAKPDFDIAARVLNRFEEMRYPDIHLNKHRQIMMSGMGMNSTSISFGTAPMALELSMNVDVLEDWWLHIHQSCGLNPGYMVGRWPENVRNVYSSKRLNQDGTFADDVKHTGGTQHPT
jgi:HEPN domain-containing protein